MKLKMPNFKSEAEEADWWYANRKQVERELRAAEKTGKGQSAAEILAEHQKRTQAINIRLPIADLERAKERAKAKGIGYQTLIRMLLHESLENTR